MGLFKCKHEVTSPTFASVTGSDYVGYYGIEEGARIKIKGVCRHCRCLVELTETIVSENLYNALKMKSVEEA